MSESAEKKLKKVYFVDYYRAKLVEDETREGCYTSLDIVSEYLD